MKTITLILTLLVSGWASSQDLGKLATGEKAIDLSIKTVK